MRGEKLEQKEANTPVRKLKVFLKTVRLPPSNL